MDFVSLVESVQLGPWYAYWVNAMTYYPSVYGVDGHQPNYWLTSKHTVKRRQAGLNNLGIASIWTTTNVLFPTGTNQGSKGHWRTSSKFPDISCIPVTSPKPWPQNNNSRLGFNACFIVSFALCRLVLLCVV